MYDSFYGLSSLPFQLTPDHRFFFRSSVHARAVAHLTYGLHQGEGFIVVTGDVGAGKTTLVEHLLSTLDKSQFVAAKIVTTRLDGDDLIRTIAIAFGLPHEGLDKPTLMQRFGRFLADQQARGKRCVLLVDEVQNLSIGALEEVRMLSNIVIDGRPPLQSLLLGQPQFRRTLASPDLDQLRQRVIASYHLGPLDEPETRAYIEHRLRLAGWTTDPTLLPETFERLYAHTGGVPRNINNLCSRLLLFGFLDEKHILAGADVDRVAEDLRREVEQVLDDSVPVDAAAEAPPSPELAERIARLERRLATQEDTLRQVLDLVIDYVQAERVG